MLGDRDQPPGWSEQPDRGDGQKADGPGPGHYDDVVLGHATAQRRVHAARERLDEDSRLVAQLVRDRVQLAWMGDEDLSPPPARVRAVTGLQADLDRALRHVVAEPRPAFGAARARWVDAAHLAPERRLHHDTRSVLERPHHLVAGDERIAGQGV